MPRRDDAIKVALVGVTLNTIQKAQRAQVRLAWQELFKNLALTCRMSPRKDLKRKVTLAYGVDERARRKVVPVAPGIPVRGKSCQFFHQLECHGNPVKDLLLLPPRQHVLFLRCKRMDPGSELKVAAHHEGEPVGGGDDRFKKERRGARLGLAVCIVACANNQWPYIPKQHTLCLVPQERRASS